MEQISLLCLILLGSCADSGTSEGGHSQNVEVATRNFQREIASLHAERTRSQYRKSNVPKPKTNLK